MKIGAKIAIAGTILTAFSVGITIYALGLLNGLNGQIKLIDEDRIPKTIQANEIIDNVNIIGRSIRNMIIFRDQREIMAQKSEIDKSIELIKDRIGKLEETITTPEGKKYIQAVVNARQEYAPYQKKTMELALAGMQDEARELLLNELRSSQTIYLDSINELIEYQNQLVHEAANESASDVESATMTLYIILGIVIFFAIGITLVVSKAITVPIGKCVEAANKIAGGDMNVELNTDKKDETGLLMNSMNKMKHNIQEIIRDVNHLSDSAVKGKLDVRADASRHRGEYSTLVSGLNSTLDAVINPLNVTAEYVDRIAKGDLPPKITDKYEGDYNEIKNNLNQLIDSLETFINAMNHMSSEHETGDIDVMMNTGQFHGVYKNMAEGLNGMVKDHINLNKSALECVSEFGSGNFDAPLEKFPGKKAFINETIEKVRSNLKALQVEVEGLIYNAKEGRLTERGEDDNFSGGWKVIVKGINEMLDAILLPIQDGTRVLKMISGGDLREKITAEYKGDHREIKMAVNSVHEWLNGLIEYVNKIASGDLTASIDKASDRDQIHEWLIQMRENIKNLSKDANRLAEAASRGDLEVRADTSKHKGDYGKIIKGMNGTFDSLVEPLNAAISTLEKIGSGDLTVEMTGDFKGKSKILQESLNNTTESINQLIGQVRVIVDQVTRGAAQVSDASSSLSQGATEQASSLEEITSSMSQMASQTRINAENAGQANMITNQAKDSAEKGSMEMSELNEAMAKISSSSQNISKIIKVIDEIAFQTNLLALNAAVEAARAGRHGKGFAVVAEEVRNLAARSASAAKETSQMIENSLKIVENGTQLADRTTLALDEIKNGAVKAADIVAEIASSSNEQATGINQINEGLSQIDKVTQTNTANAEESASAAEELSGQANELTNMIGRFKLGNENGDHSYSGSFEL
ncbi:MAG: methyl-accepting chemotaxis protein, partial [Bacteroidota bacterium]